MGWADTMPLKSTCGLFLLNSPVQSNCYIGDQAKNVLALGMGYYQELYYHENFVIMSLVPKVVEVTMA